MSHSDRPGVHSRSTILKNETSKTQNVSTGPQGVSTMSNPNHDQGDPSRTGAKGQAPQPQGAYPQTAPPASQHHAPQVQEAYGANYQQSLTSPQPDGQPTADSGAIPKVLKSNEATRSGTANGSTGEQLRSNMINDGSLNSKGKTSVRDLHPSAEPDRISDDDNDASNGDDKYEGNFRTPSDPMNASLKLSSSSKHVKKLKIKEECHTLFSVLKKILQKKYSDVELELETDTIKAFGPSDQKENCFKELEERLSKMKFCISKPFDKQLLQLLKLPEVESFCRKYIYDRGIDFEFVPLFTKEQLEVFSASPEVCELAHKFLQDSVKKLTFDVEKDNVLASKEYADLIELYTGHKLLEFNENNSTIVTVVATYDVVKEIQTLIDKVTNQIPINRAVVQQPKDIVLKPDISYLLNVDTELRDGFSTIFPQVKISNDMREGRLGIQITGTAVEIEDQEAHLLAYFDLLGYAKVEIEREKYHLINSSEVACNFLSNQLNSQQLLCYWWTTEDSRKCTVHSKARTGEIASKGAHLILDSVSVSLIHPSSIIDEKKTGRIQEIIESPNFKGKGLVFDLEEGSEDFSIVSTIDIKKEFEKQILEAAGMPFWGDKSQKQLKLQKTNFYLDKEKLEYIRRYQVEYLQSLEKKFNVRISIDTPSSLCIEHIERNNDASLCLDEIRQFSQKVDKAYKLIGNYHVSQSLKEKNIDVLRNVENAFHCTVTQSELLYDQVCTFSLLDDDFHIVLVHGRTTSLKVDAVMVPVNNCLFPIGYSDDILKDDENIRKPAVDNFSQSSGKTPQKYKCGDVVPLLGVDGFPFSIALLTVCQSNTNTSSSTINAKAAYDNVFKHCEKQKIKSLAIPVQIFENELPKIQTKNLTERLQSFYVKTETCLQELYVCVFDKEEVDEVVKSFVASFPKFDCFDWRPLLTKTEDMRDLKVEVIEGSLVSQEVDLLVNTVGTDLDLDNGIVSKSILKRSGRKIQDYCDEKYPNGIPVGTVIETPAGNMKNCKSICHGALPPKWYNRTGLSLQALKIIIWQCLTVALHRKYKSVAFPAFGTGRLNYPPREVALAMVDVIKRYGQCFPDSSLETVRIVLFCKQDDSKSLRVVKTFKNTQKNVNRTKVPDTMNVLECIVPIKNTDVCLQVLPKSEDVTGDFIVTFGKSLTKLMLEQNGAMTITYPGYKERLPNILKTVLEWRITRLCLIFEDDMSKEELEKAITAVQKGIISNRDEDSFLEVVKIYVEAGESFNHILSRPPKTDINKRSHKLTELDELKLMWKRKLHPNLRVNEALVITGKSDNVHQAKKEILSQILKIKDDIRHQMSSQRQPSAQWYIGYIQETGTKYQPVPVEVNNAVAFAIQSNQPRVEMPMENEVWVFDYKNERCCRKEHQKKTFQFIQLGKKEGQEDAGSSVDPEPVPKKDAKEEVFTWFKGDIDCTKLIMDEIRAVEKLLKENNIQILQKTSSKLEVRWIDFNAMIAVNEKLRTIQGAQIKLEPPSKPRRESESFESIISLDLTELEIALLKHFHPKGIILSSGCSFEGNKLMKTVTSDKAVELEKKFKLEIEKVKAINCSEVLAPGGLSDQKFSEVISNLPNPNEVFCHLTDDKTILLFYSPKYAALSEAKFKAEVILGMRQAGRGRRNRVIATESNLNRETKPSNENADKSRSSRFSQSMSSASPRSTIPTLQMTFKTTEGLIVKVYNGDILSLNVECIVNAANETLSHGGGVAFVIAQAAGYDFERECDDYVRFNGPIAVGSCCTTSAGKLQHYKNIIHTVGPKWHDYQDKKQCCFYLQKAVKTCFYEAEKSGLTSIAIPAISSGIFGVPKDVCCKEYANAVEDFSRAHATTTCLKEIHFVDKDMGMISMIQNSFGQKFNLTSTPSPNVQPLSKFGSSSIGGSSTYKRSNSNTDHVPSENKDLSLSMDFQSTDKYRKQFKLEAKDLKIHVVTDDIVKMKVTTIVCPQDENCSNKGAIAKAIEQISDESYKRAVMSQSKFSSGDVRKVKASPPSLPFQYVLQAIPPRYDQLAAQYPLSFESDLEKVIKNILRHCSDKSDVSSVALPVLGIGRGYPTPLTVFSKVFLKVLLNETKSRFDVKEIFIVTNENSMTKSIAEEFEKEKSLTPITSFQRNRNRGPKSPPTSGPDNIPLAGKTFKGQLKEEDRSCIICMDDLKNPRALSCGHVYCGKCIEDCFKVKPVCPTCGSIQGIIKGDQPDGTMKRWTMSSTLPGFSCQTIVIEYEIYSGKQSASHPNPGKYFKGIKRSAYLPNNKKGKLIADLLRIAFDRKLVFTIGHSRTTGEEGVVTWNDIHHKTATQRGHQFGYPDDGYFDRVLDELKIKGITEADLK